MRPERRKYIMYAICGCMIRSREPKIPRAQATRKGWKIIKTRWVDINKGDDENPNYRSRLVGKEFNTGPVDGLFAGTPPLEAVRFLIHEAATVRSDEPMGSKVLMINDVS